MGIPDELPSRTGVTPCALQNPAYRPTGIFLIRGIDCSHILRAACFCVSWFHSNVLVVYRDNLHVTAKALQARLLLSWCSRQ